MGQARLTRIDAVQEMSAAVDAFRTEAWRPWKTLDMEIRRALEWIHHDRREHWNHPVHRGWEQITAAQVQLQQAMTARRIDDHAPACIDEKKALARAKKRLETAQEKVEAVRHCTQEIDHAVDEYRGARSPFSSWLESEAPKALAALRRMMDNLEDYLAVQAHGGSFPAAMGSGRQAAASRQGAGSEEQRAASREQGAESGEQAAGSGEKLHVSADVSPATNATNDTRETPAQQSDDLSVLLPAPRSPLPAANGPASDSGDVS